MKALSSGNALLGLAEIGRCGRAQKFFVPITESDEIRKVVDDLRTVANSFDVFVDPDIEFYSEHQAFVFGRLEHLRVSA